MTPNIQIIYFSILLKSNYSSTVIEQQKEMIVLKP